MYIKQYFISYQTHAYQCMCMILHAVLMQFTCSTFWHASGETFLPVSEVIGIATTSAICKQLTFFGLCIIVPPL